MGKPSSEPFLPNIKPSYISVSILETKKGIEKKTKENLIDLHLIHLHTRNT